MCSYLWRTNLDLGVLGDVHAEVSARIVVDGGYSEVWLSSVLVYLEKIGFLEILPALSSGQRSQIEAGFEERYAPQVRELRGYEADRYEEL